MNKYEYKTVFTDSKGIFGMGGKIDQTTYQNELNELGLEGWELVNTVASAQDYGSTKTIISIFKRKIN